MNTKDVEHLIAVKLPIFGAILIAILASFGCETIRGAAGQNTFARFTADGDLEISGDGTADFDVVAKGDENGWSLALKTKTSREAVQGAAGVAIEGFRAISKALDRVTVPGFVGPPATNVTPAP